MILVDLGLPGSLFHGGLKVDEQAGEGRQEPAQDPHQRERGSVKRLFRQLDVPAGGIPGTDTLRELLGEAARTQRQQHPFLHVRLEVAFALRPLFRPFAGTSADVAHDLFDIGFGAGQDLLGGPLPGCFVFVGHGNRHVSPSRPPEWRDFVERGGNQQIRRYRVPDRKSVGDASGITHPRTKWRRTLTFTRSRSLPR